MSFILRVAEREVFGPGKFLDRRGRADAVAFVQQTTGAPHAGVWRPGVRIKDAKPGRIPRGTAIATFDDKGMWPTDSRGRHAAIYLAHDEHSIWVLDQWPTQGAVKQRAICFEIKPDGPRGNDANTFYVIE